MSRARGPAIATRTQQRPRSGGYEISHNVYYVLARLARATAARAQPALQAPPSNGRPNTGRTAPHRPSLSHPVSKRRRVGSAHHLRTGLAMRLADFIEQNAREILDDAVAFAETQAPDTVEFSAKQLRNHLPQILQAVIDDLRSPQTDSQQLAKSHGLAPLKPGPESAASYHGRTRAIAGFGLNQMVAEYRALRASVLRRWASDQRLVTSSIDDILRFNEAIDQAVAESLAQFSAEVESWRQIFLAALGHDLRGPLAAIIFSADTLASGLQDPALAKQAERIINGSMRMKSCWTTCWLTAAASWAMGWPFIRWTAILPNRLARKSNCFALPCPTSLSRMRLKAMPAVASMPLRCARRFTTSRPTPQSTANTAPMCGSALRASPTRP